MSHGRAIWAAYEDTGALSIPCPNCGAEQGVWCTKPDGRVAKTPCIARISAADIAPKTIALLNQTTENASQSIDFTEPRHPTTDRTTP